MDEKLLLAGSAVTAGLLLGGLLAFGLRRWLDHPHRRPAVREVAAPLSVFLFWMVVAAGVLLAIGVSSPESLRPIPADLLHWLPNLAIAGLLVIGGYAIGVTAAAGLGRTLSGISGHRNRTLEQTVRLAFPTLALVLAFGQLGVDTGLIDLLTGGVVATTAATVAGLSVLGGRRVAAQIAAGRSLRPLLSEGSRLEVGDQEGTVVALHPSHLVLEVAEGHRVIPFGVLHDQPFTILRDSDDRIPPTGPNPTGPGSGSSVS
ncbi:MAG TPA: hypothetical protein ENI86_11350 [Acidimicrobiales bacterium]|nr:hypothetical protein [Acidimicrobiales bacterium]